MGAKARLRAELYEAQQQRDRARRDLDIVRRDRDATAAELRRLQARPTLQGRVRNWLDELASAFGVGW